MGKVFLARDIRTRKEVAVKIVNDQVQWERERDVLKKLDHTQGIPKLFFAGEEKEFFLVMEYIRGISLKQYIKKSGQLSLKNMFVWMIRVCSILEKVHEKGIIHMDLKPENIILHPMGKIYLIDFGVSLFDGEELTGYGTKIYASKKQAKTGEKVEFLMDIYSLGKIIELNIKDPKDKVVKTIVQRCIDENEMQRYHTVKEIKKELQKNLRIRKIKRNLFFFIGFAGISFFHMTDQNKYRDQKAIYQQKQSENLKKGKMYFYGNDDTPRDLIMAKQYFLKEEKEKKKANAYLKITEMLLKEDKKVSDEDLQKALNICEKDVYDFWSAYFFEHQYVMLAEKFPKESLDRAEYLFKKMNQFELTKQKQKLIETDRLNLYEMIARKGDDRLFLKETDQIFYKKMKGEDAWELYERKISYLGGQGKDLQKEYERFIEYYPEVMDAYISYIIYLCQKNCLSKARDIYREGQTKTGMDSQRAQQLRRKLGL